MSYDTKIANEGVRSWDKQTNKQTNKQYLKLQPEKRGSQIIR